MSRRFCSSLFAGAQSSRPDLKSISSAVGIVVVVAGLVRVEWTGRACGPLLLCRRVQGLDATAARTIGTLYGTLRGRDVHLLVANLAGGETARLLRWAVLVLADQAQVRCTPCSMWPVLLQDLTCSCCDAQGAWGATGRGHTGAGGRRLLLLPVCGCCPRVLRARISAGDTHGPRCARSRSSVHTCLSESVLNSDIDWAS